MMKKYIAHLFSKMSPSLFFTIAYMHNRKRVPNFKHPRDLSEIWIKYILDGKPRQMYWLADKYRVREYVNSKGFGDILVPLVGGGKFGISAQRMKILQHCLLVSP